MYFFFEFSLVHYRISLENVVQLTFNRSSFFALVTTLDKVQGPFVMKVVSVHMNIFLVNIILYEVFYLFRPKTKTEKKPFLPLCVFYSKRELEFASRKWLRRKLFFSQHGSQCTLFLSSDGHEIFQSCLTQRYQKAICPKKSPRGAALGLRLKQNK